MDKQIEKESYVLIVEEPTGPDYALDESHSHYVKEIQDSEKYALERATTLVMKGASRVIVCKAIAVAHRAVGVVK